MFIDSSAFIAILTREPDHRRVATALSGSERKFTSGLVRLETIMVAATRLNIPVEDAQALFDAMLKEIGAVSVVPITDDIARKAVDAFARYGKGRGHPAQLNLADCMAYACARAYRDPLLFVGNDFTHTDVESVLDDPTPAASPTP
jgi:ribonuclease VapC